MTLLDLFPKGGDTIGLMGARLAIGLGGNFVLGALMMLGIGLYAPCMILVYLLGMAPTAAFPIMMGSCAFLMPFSSVRFVQSRTYHPQAALGLALAAALSWAVGNILVKRTAGVPVFPLMAWCSLVAPLPVLLLSWLVDPQPSLISAVMNASWPSIATALYLGTLATPIAYGMWSYLLQRYPASVVAPFALLSPVTGILSSALILGEVFGPLRYAGMALILAGLAVIVWPTRKIP